MKPLVKILIYLLLSIVIGAVIAPFAYWGIALLPSESFGFFSKLLHSVQQMPFHRYASRSIQVTALVLLWPMITSLKIERMSDLLLYHNNQAWRDWWGSIVMALFPLWILETLFIWKGWYLVAGTFSLGLCLKIGATAVVVAYVEEFLFRGVVLGLSRRFLKNQAAIFFATLLFAGVHFLNLPHSNESGVYWWSGFSLLSHVGSGLPAWPVALGAFITLFLLGMILAWVTIRTESLWLAIGLHSAWIFGQQLFNSLAHYNIIPSDALLPWIGPSQIYGMVPVGIITLIPLGITFALLKKWLKARTARFMRG